MHNESFFPHRFKAENGTQTDKLRGRNCEWLGKVCVDTLLDPK